MTQNPLSTSQNSRQGDMPGLNNGASNKVTTARSTLSSVPALHESLSGSDETNLDLADADLVNDQPNGNQTRAFIEKKQETGKTRDAVSFNPANWWRSLSVKTKATSLTVMLGVVPVLIVGGIATYIANQIILQDALEERQRLAVDISLELNDLVQGQLHDVETIAETPVIKNVSDREDVTGKDLVTYFNSFLDRGINYEQIAVVTADGNYIEQDQERLRAIGSSFPSETSEPQNKAFAAINSSYFFQTRNRLRPALMLQPSILSGKPTLYLAAPVLDPSSEELDYLIYSQTTTDAVAEVIRENLINLIHKGGVADNRSLPRFQVVDHGIAYFERSADGNAQEIDPTRLTVDGNTVEVDGQPFQAGETLLTKENRVVVSQGENIGAEVQSIFPKYTELRNGGVATTVVDVSAQDGQEYLLSYAPLASVEGLSIDWGVLIYEPTATAFAPQRTLLLTLSVGTIVTALLLGAVAAMLASRATRPLLRASEVVDKIGRGELDARIQVKGQDEIAALGSNINQMANQIQTYLDAQKLEAERERLLALAKGSGALRYPDLALIFEQVLAATRGLLNLDRILFYRLRADGSGSIIAEANASNFSDLIGASMAEFYMPEGFLTSCQQGETVVLDRVSQATLSPETLQFLGRLDIQSTVLIPVWSGERLFGMLMANTCANVHEWQEYEVTFLKQLAEELGGSIYRVELLEQTEKLADEQRQLKEGLQKRALQLLQEVDPVSKGDLTIRARVTADEIGTVADSYNATVDNLRRIVLQVQDAASQVVNTTNINEKSVQALSSEALRQAEEIASALKLVREMANTVQSVAANAEQAEMAMKQATQTVEEGDAIMNRTVEGIQMVRATIADTAKKVKHLGESSQKISKVVELISAFAAQTNTLALNASIEASRAGEEGRGFAVVASEVRALARQSAEATEDIRKLVASIQTETSEVIRAMESGIEQVVTGTKLVDETRQSLNKISAVSAQINELVAVIAQSTVAQVQTSETVTHTMQDVAEIASKTSSEVSQVSASFERLRQVAQTLQTGIGQFKV